MLLRVDRDVIADDGEVRLSDMRYFVTSIDPGQIHAEQLLATIGKSRIASSS